MSFANQALGAEYMLKHAKAAGAEGLQHPDGDRPRDRALKLTAMGIEIDTLTAEQKDYLAAWESGT